MGLLHLQLPRYVKATGHKIMTLWICGFKSF